MTKKEKKFIEKCREFIPCGTNTYSKMPCRYVDGAYPYFLEKGDGCYVWDTAGNKYIDYPCALGGILLGYNYPAVTKRVTEQIKRGTLFSLPHRLVGELAEKIVELIPCAQQVRFLKTGSEATSAAVKIARAYTGKGGILCFEGHYHGWHDWISRASPKSKGTVKGQTLRLNDVVGLEFFLSHWPEAIAAVIMEPCIYEELPLKEIRGLCDKYGVLLIFDEVITGFRFPGYSAQKYFGVTPDLTTLGKAMGNGFPISCVCGRKEIMKEVEGDCFVSSTFAEDLVGITAALATIEVLEKEPVIDRMWLAGRDILNTFNYLGDEITECIGFACRTKFEFPTDAHKSLFWQECLKNGVLFGAAQFVNFSHSQSEVMEKTSNAIRKAFEVVRCYWDDPQYALEGKIAQGVLRETATCDNR